MTNRMTRLKTVARITALLGVQIFFTQDTGIVDWVDAHPELGFCQTQYQHNKGWGWRCEVEKGWRKAYNKQR